jgi:transcriptional regulator with XRE-family HTH domain
MKIKERGLKSTELSSLSGIPVRWIRSWKRGNNSSLTQRDILRLADALGIEIDIQIKYR